VDNLIEWTFFPSEENMRHQKHWGLAMKVPEEVLDDIFSIPQAEWRKEFMFSEELREAKGNLARLIQKHPRHCDAVRIMCNLYAEFGKAKALMLLEGSEAAEGEKVQLMWHIFGRQN
jgi:hypothetical protein